MIMPESFVRLRRCGALLLCAASIAFVVGAKAAESSAKVAAAADTPDAVKNGELVFHGNYCGIGNRSGAEPIDALDVACMHHDACTPSGGIPSCACNAKLVEEAGAIVQDTTQPSELKALASLTGTAAAAGMVVCTPTAVSAPEAAVIASPVPLDPVLPLRP